MAIKLRASTSYNTGKGSELTYLEMDTNLESFYFSSSLSGTDLVLHTTGSDTHSIDLSTIASLGAQGPQGTTGTGAQGTQGTTGTGTQGTQGTAGTASTQGTQGTDGAQGTTGTGTQGAQGTTGTGTQGAQGTAGAGGTPGGSDTQVQFNDGGSTFGGDSGFTYNKTTNRVTITATGSATRTAPNLLLNSELASVVAGEVLGVIAANNTTDPFNPASYPASIQFVADNNFAPGTYDTSIRLYTNDGATEKEALRLINTGQNRIPQYGSGTFTGTAAYNLSVDTSGNVIETGVVQAGQTFTRPTSATSVVFDVDVNAGWTNLATASGPNPTSAGQFTTNSSTPASVTQIKINKTANASVDQSSQLEDLAVSSSLTITQAGGGAGYGTYKIVTKTDNTSYMTYDVTVASSTGGTFTNTAISTIDTLGTGEYEYVLSSGYNWLSIINNGSNSNTFRFKVPVNSATGNRVLAETQINASSPTNVFITYQARSGSVSSTGQVNKPLYTIGSSGTATTVVLDTSDVAVLEFTTWGTSSAVTYGLLPVGAVQVYNG